MLLYLSTKGRADRISLKRLMYCSKLQHSSFLFNVKELCKKFFEFNSRQEGQLGRLLCLPLYQIFADAAKEINLI